MSERRDQASTQDTDRGFTGVVWQSCSVNCGAHCILRLHVVDGRLDWVESDTTPDSDSTPQARACLRGRAMRYWLDSPDRLNYPMKRVGRRGEGKFERIGWDEAIDICASQMERIVSAYGNESVFIPYATGLWPISGSPFERLMNCFGGFLGAYGDYSCAQLQAGCLYTYGDDGYFSGSTLGETRNSDLVVFFGNSPADTRMGGASAHWEFTRAREEAGFRLITIDPRHSETAANRADEWIAIRPGTDAALVAGMAHVLITEGLVDQEFLDTYCVGYDRTTLPASAPENGSYKDYILGTGPDKTPKTPVWASAITGVPIQRIADLAREMAAAKHLYVAQGWGPQRHDNGEATARAICMLPILTGNVGLPGTNSGVRERFLPFVVDDPVIGENPVKASIPVFMWSHAVERGTELTALNAGVRGADRLNVPVKMIIDHGGNCLTNQHADINRTHDILSDEEKCEFIVVCDIQMTDSARYADLLLPDVARVEQDNLVSSGSADITRSLVQGRAWGAQLYERKSAQEVCELLAQRLGVRDAFDQASVAASDDARLAGAPPPPCDGSPPDPAAVAEQLDEHGVWKGPYLGETIAYRAFREDPLGHPLPTPSGKIEIYSERLAELAGTYEYASDQAIDPLPIYMPEAEGWESPSRARFPFQLVGYHARQRTHSSFANLEDLEFVSPHEIMVNPLDAQELDLHARERVLVENDRGSLVACVRITPRIMPGVLALPQGAWHRADMFGDRIDHGGCINTLTSDRPTALARGNAQHTILVRVRKLGQEAAAGAPGGGAAGGGREFSEGGATGGAGDLGAPDDRASAFGSGPGSFGDRL